MAIEHKIIVTKAIEASRAAGSRNMAPKPLLRVPFSLVLSFGASKRKNRKQKSGDDGQRLHTDPSQAQDDKRTFAPVRSFDSAALRSG